MSWLPFAHPFFRRRWRWTALVLLLLGLTGVLVWRGPAVLSDRHANRLADEISPYLLLHARNPVDWYPWGPEAIERARREQKPIFLSIGYSACYWCHVMERRVFSDPAIAAVMNAHFINIKVDREERPDLDEVYMTATLLLAGQGGWPNSVFLTPDLQPFYAGTYFPPADLPGQPGFPTILRGLSASWKNRRSEVLEQAAKVTGAIRAIQQDALAGSDTAAVGQAIVDAAVARLKERYDAQNAGFGGAPKFPPALELELLLTDYLRSGDAASLAIAVHTLDAMRRSGMYDHIGGGFHRYAVDARWRLPHFEKMLYNQADLARVYLLAYRVTGQPAYRRVAEDILAYVERGMRDRRGGFYAAVDAETDAVEGRYYRWTEPEVRTVLGEEADLFFAVFGLAPVMEGEGGVLYMARPLEEAAAERQMAPDALRERIKDLKTRLGAARARRKPPRVDTKAITAWNAQMIDTYAYAAMVTGASRYRDVAAAGMDFLLRHLRAGDGALRRLYRDGATKQNAFQEDYAHAIRALLRLYEASGDPRWLAEAERLTDRMERLFWDGPRGGFFFTDGSDPLIVRAKHPYDSAQPSGNAAAAHALLALSRLTGRPAYRERADRLLRAFAGRMQEEPGRFPHLILALHTYLHGDPAPARHAGRADAGQEAVSLPLQTPAPAGPREDGALVQAAMTLFPPHPAFGTTFEAVLHVRIKPGWHLNAHPASMPDLIPTAVAFNAGNLPLEVLSIAYPPGKPAVLAFASRPLSVYEDSVTIRARLRLADAGRPDAARLPLRAVVTYQACSDAVCRAPAEIRLSAPLRP